MAEQLSGQGADIADEPTKGDAGSQGEEGKPTVADLLEQQEQLKKELASLHNAVSNKEKEKKAAEEAAEKQKIEGMSAIERVQHELEQERNERKRWQREVSVKENTGKAKDFLHENGLPTDFVEFLDVSDSDSLDNSLGKLSGLVEKLKSSFAEEYATKNGQGAVKAGAKASAGGKTKQSDFTAQEAMEYAKENGLDAWQSLPK